MIGRPTIYDPNLTTERNSSNYQNPYYFQGKKLDLMDANSLELMSWPYRSYSTYLGRWLQADKLGMIPNDSYNVNRFFPLRQYEDGANYYEYAVSNPLTKLDVYGLKVCCKIKEKKTRTVCLGPPVPCFTVTTTTCTQEDIPDPDGCDPETACCKHYKDRSKVTVYGAYEHREGCSWCKVYIRRIPFHLFGRRLSAHEEVTVKCEQGRGEWEADVGLGGVKHWLRGQWVKVRVDDTTTGGDDIGQMSCDAADRWRRKLARMRWLYQFPLLDCRVFARWAAGGMVKTCP